MRRRTEIVDPHDRIALGAHGWLHLRSRHLGPRLGVAEHEGMYRYDGVEDGMHLFTSLERTDSAGYVLLHEDEIVSFGPTGARLDVRRTGLALVTQSGDLGDIYFSDGALWFRSAAADEYLGQMGEDAAKRLLKYGVELDENEVGRLDALAGRRA